MKTYAQGYSPFRLLRQPRALRVRLLKSRVFSYAPQHYSPRGCFEKAACEQVA
jgi:hypothetical protein